MVAYGHTDGVFAVGIGGDYLAVLAAERTVYGKLRSLDGIVGSGIYHASAHWE